MSAPCSLQARQLHAAYRGQEVLHGIDLTFAVGELVGILGANGAGKTTLLRLLAGLQTPAQGEVLFAGKRLNECGDRAQRLAYLEQNAECHWPLTAEHVVTLGRLPHRDFGRPLAEADSFAIEQAMREADIWHLRQRRSNELSTGERARVFLARALAVQPEMLLADEPVAGLDPAHQLAVMALLQSKARQGMGVVTVLHDLTLAARYCQRLVLLHENRVLAVGEPEAVLTREHLQTALHIRVLHGVHEGLPYLLPWQRV